MQERKILTLEEVLNLDRRPTLQEMVDLSIEDYTKYLYHIGAIKYIPESGNLKDYEPDNDWDYDIELDTILELKQPDYHISFDESMTEDEIINELKDANIKFLMKEGISKKLCEFFCVVYDKSMRAKKEEGNIYIKNEKYGYYVNGENFLHIFNVNSDGSKNILEFGSAFYLENEKYDIQNGKILTLEEVLNLKRQPSYPEMFELSIEDYTKYLYYKGIIKYIPESGSAYDYKRDNHWDYDPENDMVLILKNPNYDISLNKGMSEDEVNEAVIENLKEDDKILQKQTLNETLNVEDYNNNFIKYKDEVGSIRIKNMEYRYHINENGGMFIFTINPDGSNNILDYGCVFYLRNGGKK